MVHMQEFGGCPVTRAADPLILDSAARTSIQPILWATQTTHSQVG